MVYKTPLQKAKKVYFLQISLIYFVSAVVLHLFLLPSSAFYWVFALVLILSYLLLLLYILPKKCINQQIFLQNNILIVKNSIFNTKISYIPLTHIQYTVCKSEPIMNFFSLCNVKIITSGNQMTLFYLSKTDARKLQNHVHPQRNR